MTKSRFRTFLISLSVAVCAVCLSVGIAACSGGEEEKKSAGVYNVGEEGIYYYDAGASEYLMTLQSGVYMISVGGSASSSGTYSCDEEAGTITFTPYEGEKFTASIADGAMKLDIGTAYTFLKKIDYEVTFMSGSETVDLQSVTYGKAAKIVDAEKDGYIFLGWYTDAGFTTKYSFDTAVTGDLTLYAYYIEEDTSIPNYKVEFVSGGDVIYTTTTQNGVVYDFPETQVAGWWVSATGSGDELTYEYKGETLSESTKLFAVGSYTLGASVYADGLKWNTAVATATITVDGETVSTTAAGTSFAYDFDSLSAGRHEITIAASGATENLVYVTKALSRVSNFSVYGNVLVYNRVENAEYYCVSVECGNPFHEHTMVYNGNTLTYDFSDCEMGPDGIRFTVYAYAQGFVTSVSEVFVYALILDGTTVKIDSATDTASWTPVANATGYEVYVNGTLVATTTDTEYSFKNGEKGAKIEITVKPVAPGYYSEISGSANYTKSTLKAPEITSVSGYTISWEKIDGAVGYELNINGNLVTVEAAEEGEEVPTTFVLSDTTLGYIFSDARNAVSVTAIAETASGNSQQGDITYVTDAVMSSALSYSDGTVTWDYALAASEYTIELDGAVVATVSGTNTYGITFTHSGENEIRVYFDNSSFASLTVYTYAVIFDVRELAKETVETIYVAKGDAVALPTPTPVDSLTNFGGWYTLPDEYDKETFEYTGDGVEFVSGTSFDGNGTMILYAFWVRSWAQVTLNTGDAGTLESSTVRIAINSTDYTLPVPEITDTTKVFLGWYSQPNGLGIPYTDYTGKAQSMITGNGARTFYAYYGEAIKLSVTTYENQTVLEAKKGDDIQYVKDGVVTVPATYTVNGKEYTVAVLNSNAFINNKYIYTINIPDTMLYVSTVNNGYSSGSGAFAQSANIEAVNVYATGDEPVTTKEVRYYSEDGVLFYKSTLTDEVELLYYPQGKTTANYTVPEYVCNEYEYQLRAGSATDTERVIRTVTTIDTKVFSAHPSLTTITVPATVTTIESQAFYNCKKLTDVTILAKASSAEVSAATTLTIAGDTFKSCTQLSSVTLASRLDADSFDYGMFSGCSKLTDIYVNMMGDSSVDNYSAADGLLLNGAGNTLVYYPAGRSEFTITSTGITKIGEYAVYGNTNIKTVTIPSQIQEIGAYAFKSCTALTSLTFASLGNSNANPLTICEQAFYGCTKLTELVLPQNCTKIEVNAFGNCTKLLYVEFDGYDGTEYDYADEAFATTSGSFYVTSIKIGLNAPEINLTGVFGYNLSDIELVTGTDSAGAVVTNPNYDRSVDGLILNSDKTAILYSLADYKGEIVLPDTVTKIGDNIFRARSIKSITIPASVTEIGSHAFYNCKSLTTVTFTAAAEGETRELTIDDYAFYGCTALTEISLPAGLAEIGDRAFQGCSGLVTVTMEEGVTKIGDYVFYGCTKLKNLSIPASLESIGSEDYGIYYVFYNCSALDNLTISEESTHFATEDGIFYGLSKNENYDDGSDDGEAEYVKTDLYLALDAAEGKLEITNTINKIWYRAFYQNSGLTEIEFVGVFKDLTFGDEVFNGCTKLASIILPEGLTTLSASLFKSCTSLTSITIPTTVTQMANKVFDGCTSIEEVYFTEGGTSTLTFATGSISTSVFYGTSIKKIVLPDRVTDIPNYMFYKITTLEYVYIPYTVTSIGTDAFASTTNLEKVEIQDEDATVTGDGVDRSSKLKTIGKAAFWSSGIESINLPDSVDTMTAGTATTSAGTYSTGAPFELCANLKEITFPAAMTEIGQHMFWGCESLEKITVNGAVTYIGTYAFRACTSLKEVSLADAQALTSVGLQAFYGCKALESFTLPDKLTTLGNYAFYQTKITTVTIPAELGSIGEYAFSECSALTTVTFAVDEESKKSELTSIGKYAFSQSGITEIALPESTGANGLAISEFAFAACENLTKVHLSSSLTTMYYLFDQSGNIAEMTAAEGGLFQIKTVACKNDKGETVNVSLVLSADTEDGDDGPYTLYAACGLGLTDGVLDLTGINISDFNDSCFGMNDYLTKITIPYTVTNIGRNCFYHASNLVEVAFEALPSGADVNDYILTLYAGNNAGSTYSAECGVFSNCTSLATINLPERLLTISTNTFIKCDSLTSLAIPDTVIKIDTKAFASSTSNVLGNLAEITFGQNSQLTTLAADAFAYCSGLKSITLPKGVVALSETEIFINCTSLESVTFLSGTIDITGTKVFQKCSALKSIDLTGTTQIPEAAFDQCEALESVLIPYTVTSIGKTAFDKCTSLKTVVFEAVPDGKDPAALTVTDGTSASTGAFSSCTALETVILSERLTAIANYMFNSCTSLRVLTYVGDAGYDESAVGEGTYFAIQDGVALGNYSLGGTAFVSVDISMASSIGTYLFQNSATLTEIILPEGIEALPAGLLNGCTAVTEFEIPDTVTSIGASVFTSSSIKSISIPAAITTFGNSLFEGCTELETVEFAYEGQLTSVGGSTFKNCTSLKYLDLTGLTDVTGNYAFQAAGLVEVHIPNLQLTTTSSKAYIFMDCADLVEVELNPELQMITGGMFQNCTSLKKLYYTGYTNDGYAEDENVLPGSVTSVSGMGMQNTGLENLTIPGSLSSASALYSGTSAASTTFGESTALKTLKFEEGVTTITSWSFGDCTALEYVYIPYTVTKIDYCAFVGCTSLKTVEFQDCPDDSAYALQIYGTTASTTGALGGAFENCESLTGIDIPERTTAVGMFTFRGCSSLESIYIPSGVTTLRLYSSTILTYGYTFSGCTSLTEVVFGAGSALDEIPTYAFQGCTSLESIVLPSTVETIADNAFQDCTALTNIAIPSGVTKIAQYAFSGSGIEEILVPAGCTTIGTRAFELCHNLTSVDVESGNAGGFRTVNGALVNTNDVIVCVPAGIEGEYVIDDGLALTTTYAFNGCDKITKVVLGEKCVTVASNTFEGCTALEEIVIPETTTTINSNAFKDAASLESVYYMGTSETWEEISVNAAGNSYLTDAALYFYSATEPELNEEENAYDGNFWYYDDEGDIAIWVYEDKN